MITLPIFILFTLSFVLYSKWQFSDDRGLSQGKWHPYGAMMRILAVVTPLVCGFVNITWEDYLLIGIINILVWEIGINVIALGVKWWYIGFTAKSDMRLGKMKWVFMGALLITGILIRVLC